MSSPQPPLEVIEIRPVASAGPPVLYVHGLGHGAWCWEHWQRATAKAGHPSYAVSLRGHSGSGGTLRTARLSQYVDDVVSVLDRLDGPAVLVGHSMGGLVVQRVLALRPTAGAVLVASVPHRPGLGSTWSVLRRHPTDFLGMLAGRTLPMRPEYLFEGLSDAEAQRYVEQCGPESPLAQQQLLWHRPPRLPATPVPVLALGATADRLVPISDVRATAHRYDATLVELDGIGHNLMLDAGRDRPLAVMLGWLASSYTGRR